SGSEICTVLLPRFACQSRTRGVKRQHALRQVWLYQPRRGEVLHRVWRSLPTPLSELRGRESAPGSVLWRMWQLAYAQTQGETGKESRGNTEGDFRPRTSDFGPSTH